MIYFCYFLCYNNILTKFVIAAARVIKSVDLSVDPCENFYDFACGGWIKTHEVPSDRSNLYAYGVLRDDVTRTLKG